MSDVKKPTEFVVYTDGGSRLVNDNVSAGWGFYGEDDTGMAHTGFGGAGMGASNNVAEIMAAYHAIKYGLELDVKRIIMHLDSRYVINGLEELDYNIQNNWISRGGRPVANVSYWHLMNQVRLRCIEQGVEIDFTWVKGHNDNHGNERADKLATRGLLAQSNGYGQDVYDCYPLADGAKKPVDKKQPLHPLLTGKYWVFRTNSTGELANGYHAYATTTADEIGKRAPDTHYSIMLCKEPIPELEVLRDMFTANSRTEQVPIKVDLSVLKKGSVWQDYAEEPKRFTAVLGSLALTPENEVIGSMVRPPLLIFRFEDIISEGLTMMECPNDDFRAMEITNYFISTNSKGKQEVTKTFTQNDKMISIPNVEIVDGVYSKVNLNVAIDVPSRNTFSALVKRDAVEPIRVFALIWNRSNRSFNCCTVVQQGDVKAINFSYDSSYRIIKQ